MTDGLTLVVLAAGLGRRFGGVKQLASVGPRGEAIVDYSASGARAAGFTQVVMVVRSEIEDAVARHVDRWPQDLTVSLVAQDRDRLAMRAAAAGRTVPLGTAHAVAVATDKVDGPFAVINADDLYGDAAFASLADHMNRVANGSLVAYGAANTIIGRAPVKRALCTVDERGHLAAIEEGTVSRGTSGALWWDGASRSEPLEGDEPVSMNCWGFPAGAGAAMVAAAEAFVAGESVASSEEVLLPDVVRALIDGGTSFTVLRSTDQCLGITHPDDVDTLRFVTTKPAW